MGEELDFEVQRAWNANPCEPPCCPPHCLFQVSPEEFVTATFDDDWNTPVAEIPKRAFKIVRSPVTKLILSWSATGEPVGIEPGDLGLHKSHSSSSLVPCSTIFAECEVFRLSDFSEELKKRIGV